MVAMDDLAPIKRRYRTEDRLEEDHHRHSDKIPLASADEEEEQFAMKVCRWPGTWRNEIQIPMSSRHSPLWFRVLHHMAFIALVVGLSTGVV